MALGLDFSNDPLEVWDNTEAVTLTRVTAGDTQTAATLPALRGTSSLQPLDTGGGVYQGRVMKWFLFGVSPVAAAPRREDRITDGDGSVWAVQTVAFDELDRVYECDCVCWGN